MSIQKQIIYVYIYTYDAGGKRPMRMGFQTYARIGLEHKCILCFLIVVRVMWYMFHCYLWVCVDALFLHETCN